MRRDAACVAIVRLPEVVFEDPSDRNSVNTGEFSAIEARTYLADVRVIQLTDEIHLVGIGAD
jgi:hypothetical protein